MTRVMKSLPKLISNSEFLLNTELRLMRINSEIFEKYLNTPWFDRRVLDCKKKVVEYSIPSNGARYLRG